ncbi:hypothetical protein [Streptomyces sp. NPDC048106]|uniref:hypothetical protein n=1 Tax=Streptomyces sp. NPDC048106 TaxID=3155750 RepID=UPI003452E047
MLLAAVLVAHWLEGSLERDELHTGYFLPVVAGSFITSIGFTSIGDHRAAVAAFGAGIYFWLTLGGVMLLMVLVQLVYLPGYLHVPFSLQHWTFTFPLAVLGNDGVRWAGALRFSGWRPAAWVLLTVVTVLVGAIALRTLGGVLPGRLGARRAPSTG